MMIDDSPRLNAGLVSFVIFQGIRTSIAKKPYAGQGGSGPPVPPLDPPMPTYLTGNFSLLLITFANSLDQDQDGQSLHLDLESKPFDTPIVFLNHFLKKVNFEISQQTTTKACKNYPACKVNHTEEDLFNKMKINVCSFSGSP